MPERVKRALARATFDELQSRGLTPIGLLCASADPALIEIAGVCGYDFVVFEGEHTPWSTNEILPLVRAAELVGLVPLYRTANDSQSLIQRTLDMGAGGVVIPHVETAAQATAIVTATRFPRSGGTRGMSTATHGTFYSDGNWPTFDEESSANFIVAVIIESKLGLQNVEEIAAVDGIDYVFFGPGDLSYDLGVAPDSDAMIDAWNEVVLATRASGKRLLAVSATAGLQPDQADAVLAGIDLSIYSRAAQSELDSHRAKFARSLPSQGSEK